MGTTTIAGIVAVVVLVILIGFVISIYNRLVTLRQRHMNAFSQIDVQLKRRYDLIPNLVEVAKGYLKHERETLEAVIAARNTALAAAQAVQKNLADPDMMKQLVGAEGALGSAMMRLNAVSENYPDLKANQNMLALQEELTTTENKVAFARQGYNDAVTTYNTYAQTFPPVIFAGAFGFKQAVLFETVEAEKAAPQVKFA
jgi:LemA protein